MKKQVTLKFLDEGRQVKVPLGTTILDSALKAGVDLTSLCGGRGYCGKCQIIIEEGVENVNPLTTKEEKLLSKEKISKGYRLACCTKIYGPLVLRVPEESRRGKQQLVIMGVEPVVELNPCIQKIYVVMPEPTLEDPRADSTRLLDELRKAGFPNLKFEYSVVKRLPDVVREGNWKVTVTLLEKRRIIDIEPGDTTKRVFGFSVDIGTTKIAGFLVDLNSGTLLHANGMMNPQIRFGEDVMSRTSYAMRGRAHVENLQRTVISAINEMIKKSCEVVGIKPEEIYETTVVGNTLMHHLFLGINPKNVGLAPYPPALKSLFNVKASEIGVNINPCGNVCVLPCIAGFVGADAVADIIATNMDKENDLTLLIDVGTNTEIVLGNNQRILACSTASGPAFEGAHIKFGMHATSGAIEHIKIDPKTLKAEYKTIGDVKPKGICGSGIIDAVAEMLKAGIIDINGRIVTELKNTRISIGVDGPEFVIVPRQDTYTGNVDIVITQKDVGEVQLAKAAIRTGISILMNKYGAVNTDIKRVFMAGAFGTYINPSSARTIGILPEVPLNIVKFLGNTAGSGARLALKSVEARARAEAISRMVEYVELAAEPNFEEEYINSLMFKHTRA